MAFVEMVDLPRGQNVTSFYFDRAPAQHAQVSSKAQFVFWFPSMDGTPFPIHVHNGALFRYTMSGLVQLAVQANLEAAAAFQAQKFPVLLGYTLLENKVTFFDRSRKRLGF